MSEDLSINSPKYIPLTQDQIRQKRLRTRRSILAVFAALIVLTTLEVYFLQQQSVKTPIADNIAVLGLFNLILILLVLLIVLITRNLVKLHYERKSKIIGAKFQTKLILAFLVLAMAPCILLFFVGSKLFTYSVEKWFNLQTEQTLRLSMNVARKYYAEIEARGFFPAKRIEEFINRDRLYLKENRAGLDKLLEGKVLEYELGGALIYDNQGNKVTSKVSDVLPTGFTTYDYSHLIKKSLGGEGVTDFISFKKQLYLVAVVPMTQNLENKISVWGYILTLTKVKRGALAQIERIRKTFEEYRQQNLLKIPIAANYYATYLIITLLILFSAIWLGLYLAKGITVPIQKLAEATRHISEGNLDFEIGVKATDEIGILVDSFNKMTGELKQSKINIDHAHENLKQINTELERRRNYNETILENIGAGVISLDKAGNVTTFNKAAQNILDLKAEEVIHANYKDAFNLSLHEPMRNLIRRMIEEKRQFIEKQVDITVNETRLTLMVYIKAMMDADNRYLGLLLVFEDLTQLIKAQKVAAWKEVAQGIAHEIKNPLTPIQLSAQRLRKKYYEDKEAFARVFDESIDIISQEVTGMKDLLNEFIRFSRMPEPHPKQASLNKVIDDVSLLYKNSEKAFTIKKNFDPNLGYTLFDPEQIRRVFINLFDNALDVIPSGETIEITTQVDVQSRRVRIDFSDTGIGIRAEDRDKLFLPHFTTKKRGTGLGLAIVNRIILDHNGTIQVRDNHPRGTVFTIELPFLPPETADKDVLRQKEFRKTSPSI